MHDILAAAGELQTFLEERAWRFAFIGGVANLAWGEIRTTRDADLSLFTSFEGEAAFVDALLARYGSRVEDPVGFALRNRVLLLRSSEDVPLDIGLAGFEYELAAIDRSVIVDYGEGIALRVICAEDLIVMKAFAGRDQDWADVTGIVRRQGLRLDWTAIEERAALLAEMSEDDTMLERLQQIPRD